MMTATRREYGNEQNILLYTAVEKLHSTRGLFFIFLYIYDSIFGLPTFVFVDLDALFFY